MRIFHIMLSKELGGIQQAFLDYTRAMAGHEVHLVCHPRAAIWKSLPAHLPQHPLPNCGNYDLFSSLRLAIKILRHRPDILLVHGGRAAVLARRAAALCRLLGHPVILCGVCHNEQIRPLQRLDHIITITEHLRQHLIEKGTAAERISVLPNMIDLASRGPIISTSTTSDRSGPITFGSMGRYVQKKGFHTWIKSLALLRDQHGALPFRAVLAGDGPEKPALQALIAQYRLTDQLQCIDWVTDKDAFFQHIDVFVCPSHHEPFGIVLLEAMARHVPVISTASEGPREIITHGEDGILVPPADAEALCSAQHQAQLDRAALSRITQAAYRKLELRYDLPVVAQRLEAILAKHGA